MTDRQSDDTAPERTGWMLGGYRKTQMLFVAAKLGAVADRAEALTVIGDSVFNNPPARLPQRVARIRLPGLCVQRAQVEARGPMSNGPDFLDLWSRLAGYVGRILEGAARGDFAIEQPMTFRLVIHRRTANALGLTIPQSLLLSAEVIE